MKKILAVLVLVLLSTVSFAQWTTAPGNVWLQTPGNVGIGTATPAFLLDVTSSGNASITAQSLNTSLSDHTIATFRLKNSPTSEYYNMYLRRYNGDIEYVENALISPGTIYDISKFHFSTRKLDFLNGITDITYTNTGNIIMINTGNVGIGKVPSLGKLDVLNQNSSIQIAGRFINDVGGSLRIGVTGNALHSNINIGVYGSAVDPAVFNNCGVRGRAERGGLHNFGGHFYAPRNGNPPLTPGTSWAGYFVGDVSISGDLWVAGVWHCSDSTLKKNINNLTDALSTINQLYPKTFDFKVNEYPYLNLPREHQFGFIAQDVKNILPDLVDSVKYAPVTDTSENVVYAGGTFLSLNYNKIIPFAIRGIQELEIRLMDLFATAVKKSCPLTLNYLPRSTGTDAVCNSQIFDNGTCVGIGTSAVPAGYKLVVEGKLGARDVFVACVGWPDYVFGNAHKLKPLDEVENYISANKHLPGIPSSTEIEQAGGLNLGDMQTRQMEKIEELYKYIIEMNKNMQQLSLENKELKERMQAMEHK
jgi:hypothetical protein